MQRVSKYIVHIIGQPLAAVFDSVMNTVLIVVKIVGVIFLYLGFLGEKKTGIGKRITGISYIFNQVGRAFESYLYLFYQCIAMVSINYFGPQNNLYYSSRHWAYLIRSQGTEEVLLNMEKVEYLRRICLWNLSDDEFKNYCPNLRKDYDSISIARNPRSLVLTKTTITYHVDESSMSTYEYMRLHELRNPPAYFSGEDVIHGQDEIRSIERAHTVSETSTERHSYPIIPSH